MLQNPKIAFRDPELQSCTIEKDALGQPKARSGNFATVYRGVRPDGTAIAVRVFNRRSEQRRQRYEVASEYLAARNVPCLVRFSYEEQAIRSGADGKFYPLVRMAWVPGVTLFEWVRDRARAADRQSLALAAQEWADLVRGLANHGLVHGDLQHGNVMVADDGRLTLVDYDCLGVPALKGQPNLETGLPPYQHPGRNADTALFAGLDNFSAIVIYVALRALSAEPELWTTFVDRPNYDRLLFRTEDFSAPARSPLRDRLLKSPEEEVRDLAYNLFALVHYDLHDIPTIDDFLVWCDSLPDLLARGEWDRAVRLVARMGPADPIPGSLLPQVAEAHRRAALRKNRTVAEHS
jgi:hypothetical protein